MRYCALTFNGALLDEVLEGYTTANVEGRGVLNREIDSVNIPGRDGVYILDQKLPSREITVYYTLKSKNAIEKQQRIDALHQILSTTEDAEFSFGDEDYIRYGRLLEAKDPPYDSLQGVGSFTLICQDPYKYSEEVTETGQAATLPTGSPYPYKLVSITMTTTASDGLMVKNETTGRKIVLTGAFTDGQTLTITDDAITLNGQNISNRIDFVESDRREFKLHSGDRLSAPSTMTIRARRRFL